MDRQEVMDELSDVFKPAQVWAYSGSWTFMIETDQARVLTISETDAAATTADRLREIVHGMPAGHFSVLSGGALVAVDAAKTSPKD